jgi:hypothetical protein
MLRWTYTRTHLPTGRKDHLVTEPMPEAAFLRELLRWVRQQPTTWAYREGHI